MKKLISLVLALAMIMMIGAAFAADPAPTTSTLPKADISITNMEIGDEVSLYKIIKWDTEAADWAFNGITVASPFDTVEKLIAALADDSETAPAAMTALTEAVGSAQLVETVTNTTTTYTKNVEVGSYLALVVGANGNIYNPMVLSVSFDYSTQPAGATDENTLNADTAVTGKTIVAKKQPVNVNKEVEGNDKKHDVAVTDTVPFLVHTQTPNYGTNYKNPVFVITDTLSEKLEMTDDQQTAIKVVVDNTNPEQELTKGTDYTIETSKSGYTISFAKAYLNKVKANTAITVKYTATVKMKDLMHNVEQYDNDVDITYSNSPTTSDGHDHDETHHYTFSIDATLVGQDEGGDITKELVKIGRNAETGEIITSWNTLDENSWTSYGPLKDAEFKLVGEGKTYTATSDADGFLKFEGLDAGNYTLTETSAPAGYKYSKKGVPVKITADYNDDGTLKEYWIEIGENPAKQTTHYNATAYSEDKVITETTIDNTSKTTGIINEEAVTLPSTGGIGTTIFYILGGVLVIGAAVILVARRKAHD